MPICYWLTVTFVTHVQSMLWEEWRNGILLKPLQKTFHVEKWICGKVGKQAVGACKTEWCKREHDYRGIEQQSTKLNYSAVIYGSSIMPSIPFLLDSRHQYTWLFCICGDVMSMCHWGHHPVQATFVISFYLSFDKGQKDMREMLCTSTVCPQSLGESSSWGWDRKTCPKEVHDT